MFEAGHNIFMLTAISPAPVEWPRCHSSTKARIYIIYRAACDDYDYCCSPPNSLRAVSWYYSFTRKGGARRSKWVRFFLLEKKKEDRIFCNRDFKHRYLLYEDLKTDRGFRCTGFRRVPHRHIHGLRPIIMIYIFYKLCISVDRAGPVPYLFVVKIVSPINEIFRFI